MYSNTQVDYKPKVLNEFVFADKTAEQKIDSYINGRQTKPIILYGSYGTGKSLLTDLIPKEIDGSNANITRYEASDLDSSSSIAKIYFNNKMYNKFFKPENQRFNYIVIEELNFRPKGFSGFRLALDDTEGTDLTIITTNELEKIDAAVRSRATLIEIKPASPTVFLPRAKQIIIAENCKIPDSKLLKALESVSGDYKGNRAYYEVIDELLLEA